jgi:hypothetical protein
MLTSLLLDDLRQKMCPGQGRLIIRLNRYKSCLFIKCPAFYIDGSVSNLIPRYAGAVETSTIALTSVLPRLSPRSSSLFISQHPGGSSGREPRNPQRSLTVPSRQEFTFWISIFPRHGSCFGLEVLEGKIYI